MENEVWTLIRGEKGEGGTVIGVFTNPAAAHIVVKDYFPQYVADPKGEYTYVWGCDFLHVEHHKVYNASVHWNYDRH